MLEISANLMLPKALKSCPRCKKSPNLVTLKGTLHWKWAEIENVNLPNRWCKDISKLPWVFLKNIFCKICCALLWYLAWHNLTVDNKSKISVVFLRKNSFLSTCIKLVVWHLVLIHIFDCIYVSFIQRYNLIYVRALSSL